MKQIFILLIILCFMSIAGCKNPIEKNDQSKRVEQNDSLISLSNSIKIFNNDEKAALDSIAKYKLNSVYDICLKYLYVTMGMAQLKDDYYCKNNNLTIGECKIRIGGIEHQAADVSNLIFGVFMQDSIPCSLYLNTSQGEFPVGFAIDIKKRKILYALIGGHRRIKRSDVEKRYDSIVRSEEFKTYLEAFKDKIHPEFKKLLTE